MVLVTSNAALIMFAVILVVAALVAWYMKDYSSYDKGSFHTFIAILAGLGVFVTFMFYYNILVLQAQQQNFAAIETLSHVNDVLLNSVLDSIKESSEVIPNFVLSITPLTNTVCSSTAPSDPINPQTCTEKMILSYRIFSLWQDVVLSNTFLQTNPINYIANFLQRANSSQLYDQWTVNKLNFNSNTQIFGDLLFEYGLPIIDQTPESYITTSQKLIQDPRYKAIFK